MKMRMSVFFLFSVSLSNDDRVERSQVSFKQNCNSAQVMAASNVGVFRGARYSPTWIPRRIKNIISEELKTPNQFISFRPDLCRILVYISKA